MDTLQLILGAAIALFGVWIGGQVAKKSGFIYPWDFVTVGLAVAGSVYTLLWSLFDPVRVIDPVWMLPFFVGYLVGYCLIGFTSYVMVFEAQFGDKSDTSIPWVFADNGREYILFTQSWAALWDRWVHGIDHHLRANTPLDADWNSKSKFPGFPTFEKRKIYLEQRSERYAVIKKGRIRELREYTTHVIVARASMLSKAQLAVEEDTLYKLQVRNAQLEEELYMSKIERGHMVEEAIIQLSLYAASQSPAVRAYDHVAKWREFMERGPSVEKAAEIDAESENIEAMKNNKEEVMADE